MAGRFVLMMVAGMLSSMTLTSRVHSQQTGFRVETDLFRGDEVEPFHQTVTLFFDGVAYDTPRDQGMLTMIDPKRDRIILLDETRQVQTEVDLLKLRAMIEKAKTNAFAVTATLIADAEKVVASEDRVTAGDALIRYDATFQLAHTAAIAQQYAEFADASAMLNAGHDPAALPYARLNLNKAIAEKNALPKEITKTVSIGKIPQVHRSILHANWRLSKDDETRIAKIGTMLVSYPSVSQQEFFQPAKHVAQQPATQK